MTPVKKVVSILRADLSDRAVKGVGLQTLDCWHRGFESRWGHGCSSLVFVVCFERSGLPEELIIHSEELYWIHVCVCVCVCVWSIKLKIEAP